MSHVLRSDYDAIKLFLDSVEGDHGKTFWYTRNFTGQGIYFYLVAHYP